MDHFYLVLIFVLAILAISDIIVGVGNDAVNFLNSGFGSRAATRWVLITVASLGVLLGSFFSGGMIEVARTGIFQPQYFNFHDIILICFAVMITDILLLDLFNTFGLPTSTTVSLIFEMLGGSVAISLVKIKQAGTTVTLLGDYINTDKALFIISGILFSVVFAFTIGAVIQYITRIVFSFRTKKSMKYFGAIFGGSSITALFYFLLINTLPGSKLFHPEIISKINQHLGFSLFIFFVVNSILIQLLVWIFRINIAKLVVLAGTFALAMAFAGNDLVNFIGIPIVGYESYLLNQSGQLTMDGLANSQWNHHFLLFIAGIVMVFALWFSRKARNVIQTEVNLGRQWEGFERFESSVFSRLIVRKAIRFSDKIQTFVPAFIKKWVQTRFNNKEEESLHSNTQPAFDTLRAAVNLIVSSVLISIGTSMLLPLSTTYVTFMVAMGTSLADGAWSRESAVYRVSGVITVIGGWFFSAIVAFASSFLVALFLFWSGMAGIVILLTLGTYLLLKSYRVYRNKENVHERIKDDLESEIGLQLDRVFEHSNTSVVNSFIMTSKNYFLSMDGLIHQNLKQLRQAKSENDEYKSKTRLLKDSVYRNIGQLGPENMEAAHFYLQLLDFYREIGYNLEHVVEPSLEHVENNHKPLSENQTSEFSQLNDEMADYLNFLLHQAKEKQYSDLAETEKMKTNLLEKVEMFRRAQIKRIRKDEVNTRNSVLFFNILNETKNLIISTENIVRVQRKFCELLKNRQMTNENATNF